MYVDHVTGSNLLEFRCVQSRRRVVGISDDSRRDKKVAGSANFGTSPSSPTWVKSLLSFVLGTVPKVNGTALASSYSQVPCEASLFSKTKLSLLEW